MPTYSILNSRKRAIIALVHTVVFFFVALLVLVRYGRAALERLYFALCASSAALGLLRFTIHHPAVHSAQVLRPAALACAALVVAGIARAQAK